MDLINIIQNKGSNGYYKHIVVATDILSHFAWIRALTYKTSREASKSLPTIFEEGRVPLSELIKVVN